MKVAVWDTYVKSRSGAVFHFDIIVPENIKDEAKIYDIGKKHLQVIGEDSGLVSTNECQFCHIEEPTPEMVTAIRENGYYILEMDTIPATLNSNPSRRDKILYLKGHYPKYRFQSFSGISEDEIDQLFLNIGR